MLGPFATTARPVGVSSDSAERLAGASRGGLLSAMKLLVGC